MKHTRTNASPRRTLASLALAGGLTALAITLGAGTGRMTKQEMVERMIDIGQQISATQKDSGQTATTPSELQQLLQEYRALSQLLGGDDPAHLGLANPAARLPQGGDEGGIASAPPAPPGCSTTTTAFSNLTVVPLAAFPATATSSITVSGIDSVIWDVNLTTAITHTFGADIDMSLTSPAGTSVTITTDNGGGFDNVYNGTLWDDDADPDGVLPYTANDGMVTDATYVNLVAETPLVPEEAMAAFMGEDPNGVWTLIILDDLGGDTGSLNSWSLDITTIPLPLVTSSSSATNPTPVAIPTGPAVVSSTIVVSGLDPVLTDVDATTFITHTNNADIDMTLTSPAGTVVTLTTDNGGTNDNVYNGTLWDDDADPGDPVPYLTNNGVVTDHVYANLTLATPMVPEEAMGAFVGENPNGTWTLTISDDLAANGGSLDSWSLALDMVAAAPTTTISSFSNTTPVPINDPPASLTVSSTLAVSGVDPSLWDLDISTLIQHSANADIDMTLMSPAGTIVTLTTDNGGVTDDGFHGTLWDDDANPGGQVPYLNNEGLVNDATYADFVTETPLVGEEALGAFIGEDPNGVWTLTLSDDLSVGDGGNLHAWTLSVTTLSGAPTTSLVSGSNTTPVAITAVGMPTISSSLGIVSPITFICDVNVTLNVAHTFCGDLDMTLLSPSGTIVSISTDNGGVNDNVFAGTLFDDDADPDGQVPYTTNANLATDHPYVNLTVAGALAPEEALAAFIGEDPNGTWTLTISDDANLDGGSLNSWSLDIVTCECAQCIQNVVNKGTSFNQVDVDDLLFIITNWGPCPAPPAGCPANIAFLGLSIDRVDVDDLLAVITRWGPCPD